jgi:hypothetical protein
MTVEKLKEKIERVPFQPFELELCDGDTAYIDSPKRVLMLKSKLLISSGNSVCTDDW